MRSGCSASPPSKAGAIRCKCSPLSAASRSIVVVEACLQHHQIITDHPVDEAVLLVYPSRPDIAGTMFEPFRLTATVCGIAHRVIDEDVDAFEKSTVVDLPLLAVVPPGWVKDQPHDRSRSRAA